MQHRSFYERLWEGVIMSCKGGGSRGSTPLILGPGMAVQRWLKAASSSLHLSLSHARKSLWRMHMGHGGGAFDLWRVSMPAHTERCDKAVGGWQRWG